jgi:hypothetical protein
MATLMIAACVLTGCGSAGGGTGEGSDGGAGSGNAEALSTDTLKTFGDVIALEGKEELQNSVGNGKVVYAFKKDGTYYRIWSEIPKELEQEYIDIDISQEGYEDKQNKLIENVEVGHVENLSEQMLSEEALKALAGKTGKELVAEGWSYQGSYNLEVMEVYMDYGPFAYVVTFDGKIEEENSDDFDIEAATKDRKCKAARFESLGNNAVETE